MKSLFGLLTVLLLASPVQAWMGPMMGGGSVPTKVSGYFGNTDTLPGSYLTTTLSASTHACTGPFSPAQNGTVTAIEIYSSNTTSTLDVKVGLYTDSSGPLNVVSGTPCLLEDVGTWSASWKSFACSGATVSSATSYWICLSVSASSQLTFYYISDANPAHLRYSWAHTFGDAWVNDPAHGSSMELWFAFRAVYEY